jgi:predicted dehydrogenase
LADDIDVVDISTPNHLHEPQACAALAAGKHVLLQKPMANSLAAADKIVAAAAKSKGTLGMYMASFNNPMSWEIKKLITSGALGRIQSVRSRDAHRHMMAAQDAPSNWRASLEKTGGGSFLQLSVHAINLIQWWLDRPITQVTAFSGHQYCPNVGGDDVTCAAVRFGQDSKAILGVFDSGYASAGFCREIHGDKGSLRITWEGDMELIMDEPYSSPVLQYTSPGELLRLKSPEHDPSDVTNPLNQNRMFLEAVAAGRPPHMNAAAGRQDMAVVMAVYKSAQTNRAVRIADL